MTKELVVKGKLPDVIEEKYKKLMEGANHASKKRSLTAVRNAIVDLLSTGDTELKYADVGRISFGRYSGPKAQTISNATSKHLQTLIACALANIEKPKGGRTESEEDKLLRELMPLIDNRQLRQQLRMMLHEISTLRGELNRLKNSYHKDKTPLQFVLPATTGSGSSDEGPKLEALNLDQVKAIGDFLNSLDDKIGGSGIYRNEFGALEDVEGNEVAGVGFVDALERVLEIYDAD